MKTNALYRIMAIITILSLSFCKDDESGPDPMSPPDNGGTPGITYTHQDNSPLPNMITLTEADVNVEYEYKISLNTQPSGDVMVDISLHVNAPDNLLLDNGGVPIGAGNSIELMFTSDDWNSPQIVKLTLGANSIASGNASVTITHSSTSGDSDYDSIPDLTLMVTAADDEIPTITVPSTVMINEGEDGDISVSISHQPTEEVLITLTENSSEASISPGVLTFTTDNWNTPKTVTITIQDNDILTANRDFDVSYAASTVNQMNPYNGISISNTTVTIKEDDTINPMVTVPSTVMINEGGDADISVSISHQPTEKVLITLTENSSEASISPGVLTFTPDNWNTPKTSTITIQDNDVVTANRDFNVSYAASTVNQMNPYNGVTISNTTVTIKEDDTINPMVTVPSTVIVDEGDSDDIIISISQQPTEKVLITLTENSSEASISPGIITFTPDNWNTPKVVTITIQDNDILTANRDFDISYAASTINRMNPYNGVTISNTTVTIQEDDGSTSSIVLSTSLPIIEINTQGMAIVDEPKINATMRIRYKGNNEINNFQDAPLYFNGHIGIELRGSSSQSFPKKQYAVETRDALGENLNISLFGMPAENDWILHAPYSDKTLLRNVLAYELGRNIGMYTSKTQFCEVVINGEYFGVYVWMEKIKRDKKRVNVPKLNKDEISGDDVTGGYIIKVDKETGDQTEGWRSTVSKAPPEFGRRRPPPPPGSEPGTLFQYHYPNANDIVTEQKQYIQNYMNTLETNIAALNRNSTIYDLNSLIDTNSWIGYAIINELAKNVDGYNYSSFMYKFKDSENSVLHFGPIWDFNLGFGNVNYGGGDNPQGLLLDNNTMWRSPFFRSQLWDNIQLRSAFYQRWLTLRTSSLSNQNISNFINEQATLLVNSGAIERNFRRWPILGRYIWPNPRESIRPGRTYIDEVNSMINWISQRLNYIDSVARMR